MQKKAKYLLPLMCLALAGCTNSSSSTTDSTVTTTTTIGIPLDDDAQIEILGQYIGVEYVPYDTTVTDEEIDETIASLLSSYPNYISRNVADDYEIAEGDTITISIAGYIDDEQSDDYSSDEYTITIGDSEIFSDGAIGKHVGDEYETTHTYSEDAYDSSGNSLDTTIDTEVVFKCTILDVVESVDYLTDDYVVEFTSSTCSTVEEYRSYIEDYLLEDKEETAETTNLNSVLETILANTTFKELDSEEVQGHYDTVVSQYQTYATNYSMELEDFVTSYVGYDSLDDFYADVTDYAERITKRYAVVDAISKLENIEISNENYYKYLNQYMDEYSYTDADEFIEDYGEDVIRESMIYDITLDFVMENAIAVDSISTSENNAEEIDTSDE